MAVNRNSSVSIVCSIKAVIAVVAATALAVHTHVERDMSVLMAVLRVRHVLLQSLVYITDLVGLVLSAYTAGHIYVNLVRCSSSSWT